MDHNQCLYCYRPLYDGGEAFHPQCSKKIFNAPVPPVLDYTNDQMLELAQKVIQSQTTVTGVQPKLSLGLQKAAGKEKPQKLTIMGVFGSYILKPPSEYYPNLPELEDLTMHLAAIAGIETVPHTLIRLKSGELSYLTRRVDRKGRQKLHMEDMCQLTERMTEAKYRGSYEQIAKALARYSENPGLDVINFFEQVVFGFLTGNSDMHLKNFSLLKDPVRGYNLSPAYDMVAASLVVEGDEEELALTLNGKKKKIQYRDFSEAMGLFGLSQRPMKNIFGRFQKALPRWHEFIDRSFLPLNMKAAYHAMLDQKATQINL